VGSDASIDFMSFPRFDSPTVFAALLDYQNGGRFKIAPALEHARQKQLYFPDSNMLLSRFLSDEGVAEVSDFMAVEEVGHPHTLIRRATTIRGEVAFRMECAPRFDYGRARYYIEHKGGEAWLISEGADRTALRLRCSVPFGIERTRYVHNSSWQRVRARISSWSRGFSAYMTGTRQNLSIMKTRAEIEQLQNGATRAGH
jgi:GH15 family glucan-1,4-alpha-glucosidase